MLTASDNEFFQKKGITTTQIEEQLRAFSTGFPYLQIRRAAESGKGLTKLSKEEQQELQEEWDAYLQTNARVLKFVPASGAASRMFKDLFEFLESNSEIPVKAFEKKFFDEIEKFAFYDDLDAACIKNAGQNIRELIAGGKYKAVVENLLSVQGLNYGSLPKGLLKFHSYPDIKRTAFQEHLVEGALYAANRSRKINIHFTVSTGHRILFEKHLAESLPYFEKKYAAEYLVNFSEQKPSTDTIAADMNNEPFRDNGNLLFRPGGHGALIENLNDLDADVVFIKNIDNVVPDNRKDTTVTYKKLIAGLLIKTQKTCFQYLKTLESKGISPEKLDEIAAFCEKTLCIQAVKELQGEELKRYLFDKLNRPIRICGMVKNEGEPGGGPFITVNADGTASPQILESSQIDLNNPEDKRKMQQSTYFNPVDLACAVKNYKGEKFDLLKYVDKNTGFISLKSKNGKELKALELPGLWNGAMSDWNTIFVETPVETFNPVKTVNDLLRPEHQ
ncbi:MAG: DUF4301 family protein [Prevotellaceae bacterium]|jgi:hypothetical protein|nr:DUF4301 family protein [Prevotellaceae bacterium]